MLLSWLCFSFSFFFFHCQETTHLELKQTSMLSAVASLTPYSDFNQSPRNMYQCQVNYLQHVITAWYFLCKLVVCRLWYYYCHCTVTLIDSHRRYVISMLFRWENKRWEHQRRHWNTGVITNCIGYRWGGTYWVVLACLQPIKSNGYIKLFHSSTSFHFEFF